MQEFPKDLLNYFDNNKSFTSITHTSYAISNNDPECVYYPIKFSFDQKLLLTECQSVDDLFVYHRGQEQQNGYGHRGWQSLTLHGIDHTKTDHFTAYGFKNREEAGYHWTDVCQRTPNLYSFLSNLPYRYFERVRIMRLAPGGYIMPHCDGTSRTFTPLNIAINNPDNCYFVFKNKGIVPFEAGTGMVVDVSTEHTVINFSDQVRYHIIVHGFYNQEFYDSW
jgi:hypothetical protein